MTTEGKQYRVVGWWVSSDDYVERLIDGSTPVAMAAFHVDAEAAVATVDEDDFWTVIVTASSAEEALQLGADQVEADDAAGQTGQSG